ncbi:MAG: MarR family winged helix-turn-helix transcriptional regulator [Caldimonas sp.]
MTRVSRSKVDKVFRPPGSEEAATLALQQFRQIFNAVRTHFQQVEKKVGLGGSQVWALSLVRDFPDIGVGRLAHAMTIHQSTASNLVKILVERELVVAIKSESDRRTVGVRLLPAGRRVLQRSPQPFAGVLPMALNTLEPKTLKRLNIDLATLLEVLQTGERGANIPLADI